MEESDRNVSFAPCESTVALTEGMFKLAGEPSPSFLSMCVFHYLSKGIGNITVHWITTE